MLVGRKELSCKKDLHLTHPQTTFRILFGFGFFWYICNMQIKCLVSRALLFPMWFVLRYFRSVSLQRENLSSVWHGTWQLWETFSWRTRKGTDGPSPALQRDLSLGTATKNRNVFCSNLMTSQHPRPCARNGATNTTAREQPAALAVAPGSGSAGPARNRTFSAL